MRLIKGGSPIAVVERQMEVDKLNRPVTYRELLGRSPNRRDTRFHSGLARHSVGRIHNQCSCAPIDPNLRMCAAAAAGVDGHIAGTDLSRIRSPPCPGLGLG